MVSEHDTRVGYIIYVYKYVYLYYEKIASRNKCKINRLVTIYVDQLQQQTILDFHKHIYSCTLDLHGRTPSQVRSNTISSRGSRKGKKVVLLLSSMSIIEIKNTRRR